MSGKAQTTLLIEKLLAEGNGVSAIARAAGVSRRRVYNIKQGVTPVTVTVTPLTQDSSDKLEYREQKSCPLESTMPNQHLIIDLSPGVMRSLAEAVKKLNLQAIRDSRGEDRFHTSPEIITKEDYVEELIMNDLADQGLLRKG